MVVWTVARRLAQSCLIEPADRLGKRELFCENLRNADFIDVQIRIGCYDGSTRKIDAFAHHIHAKKALKMLL